MMDRLLSGYVMYRYCVIISFNVFVICCFCVFLYCFCSGLILKDNMCKVVLLYGYYNNNNYNNMCYGYMQGDPRHNPDGKVVRSP